MEILTIAFLISFGFILLGVTFLAYSGSFLDAHQVSQRIETFVIEDQSERRSREMGARRIDFSESLLNRTIIPLFSRFFSALGRFTPAQSIDKINRDLALAGVAFLKAQQYYAVRMLLMGLGLAWFVFDYFRNPNMDTLMRSTAVVIVMFIVPVLWLRMKVARRQEEIRRSIPDALDMLSISTAAGLGFDQSLMKVSQFFKSAAAEEFARVVSEIEVGVSRQDALRNFSNRVGISEIASFVAVIIQSEILGMSIADVLHAQAEQMRIQRQYRAKELAQRLPVKMMVPLALLILPALLAVLLGPTIPALLDIF